MTYKGFLKTVVSTVALSLIFQTNSGAQQNAAISTGYFNDGYIYKHRLNPALVPTMGHVSLPFVGNIFVQSSSNLSFSDFIYPEYRNAPWNKGGKIPTFLSVGTPDEVAMRGIKNINHAAVAADISFLSLGIFNSNGNIFTNFEIRTRVGAGAILPRGVFELLRGTNNADNMPEEQVGKYDLAGTYMNANVFSEVAFGQSFNIMDKARFGYKVKGLAKHASARFNAPRFDVFMSAMVPGSTERVWLVNASGDAQSQGFTLDNSGQTTKVVTDPQTIMNHLFDGLGFGVDLGFTWDILEYLNLSAAVNDLGCMFLKNQNNYALDVNAQIGHGSELKIEDLLRFEDKGIIAKATEMLPCTVRGGLQFRIPAYQKISFGALYSQHFEKRFGWWETRASFNYDVCRIFAFSLSYAYGTAGHQAGAILTLHCPGFALFAGLDNVPLSFASNMIPLKTANLTAHMGIAFQFGKYFGRYPKVPRE